MKSVRDKMSRTSSLKKWKSFILLSGCTFSHRNSATSLLLFTICSPRVFLFVYFIQEICVFCCQAVAGNSLSLFSTWQKSATLIFAFGKSQKAGLLWYTLDSESLSHLRLDSFKKSSPTRYVYYCCFCQTSLLNASIDASLAAIACQFCFCRAVWFNRGLSDSDSVSALLLSSCHNQLKPYIKRSIVNIYDLKLWI